MRGKFSTTDKSSSNGLGGGGTTLALTSSATNSKAWTVRADHASAACISTGASIVVGLLKLAPKLPTARTRARRIY